jgi:peptide/nickel transport system substrate-binding protein
MLKTLTQKIALAGVLAVALAASAYAQELRIGTAADVSSMDPHAINIAPNNQIGWHVYDALVNVDADVKLVPGLATSWRAVDPTTWEFKLRRNVKFHDGSPFTAEDVIFSMERALTLPNGQYASFLRAITDKKIVDPYTVRFKTATPYAMVPPDLNSIFIVSKKAATGAATEDFNSGKAMVGTGPFKFVRYANGDRVELARNDAYWGGKPHWAKVTFRILPSDPTRLAALLAGDVYLIESIPSPDLAKLKTNKAVALAQKVSWRTIFFHMDQWRDNSPFITDKAGKPLEKNPLKDRRVRLALSKAISRAGIVDRIMEGAAIPAANIVSPPVYGHVKELKPEAYDVEGAKKLLAEAGYPDGFAMTVHAPNNRYPNDEQIALAVAQMLARIGIQTKVDATPISVYLPKMRNGEFSFAMLGWGSFSGDLALRALLASQNAEKGYGTWNWSHYSNPKVDQLLDQGFATVDSKKREVMAREAAGIALRDIGVVPMHHQLASWAMKPSLRYAGRTDEYTFAHHVMPR